MSNWLDVEKWKFANASIYVQLAVMGVQLILKYAPPLFELISNLVDDGFELIEVAKKSGGDVEAAKKKARESAVEVAMKQFPDVPESRIRSAVEDMKDVKKVIRAGTDESRAKEAHAVSKGVINIYEVERLKETYPQLFGEYR